MSDPHENITDWALEQFRVRYDDRSITKWDIFHYFYAVLHHPEYRQRYAANLRRELPRIPFVGATTTLSSRAQQNGSLANNSPESRDPVLAGGQHRPPQEFSTGTSSRQVRDKNASQGHAKLQAGTGSFDSVHGLVNESTHSGQDDRTGVGSDLDVLRAFVRAG